MVWERTPSDEIDQALDHFSGLAAAGWARVCSLIAEVDRRQSWMTDGARNLTDWVAAHLRLRHESAAQLVRIARRLVDLPMLYTRFSSGELSLDQVDAISSMATPETESGLLEQADGLTNAALDRAALRRRGLSEAEARSVWERRRLVRQWNLDQSELRFHGRLPGEAGRIFDEAIDDRIDEVPPNPDTGVFDAYQTRAADALTGLAASNGTPLTPPSHMTIFADFEALTTASDGVAELDNGALIPNPTAQRLACDSVIRTVVRDGQAVIGIGRASRQIPSWLRDLVYQRDGYQCQHPRCRNTRWLQIHHVVPWAQEGPTDLDNLVLLCGFHHRFVHQHGWHITGPPGKRMFRRPDWSPCPRPKPALHPRLATLVRTT